MSSFDRNPSARSLRFFGILFMPILAVIIVRVAGLDWAAPGALAILGLGGVGIVLGTASPKLLRPLYIGWMTITEPIGKLITFLLLSIMYFVIVTPAGLLFRLFGYDPMQRSFDRAASTYWEDVEQQEGAADAFKPW